MKASEVLKRYKAGERDFRGVNLRGQSFKGQDLSGANFSEADLRSTNFTGATLRRTNFTGAKCGLQESWVVLIIITLFALIFYSGFYYELIVSLFLEIFQDDLKKKILQLFICALLVSLGIVTIRQGIKLKSEIVFLLFLSPIFVAIAGIIVEEIEGSGLRLFALATGFANAIVTIFIFALTLTITYILGSDYLFLGIFLLEIITQLIILGSKLSVAAFLFRFVMVLAGIIIAWLTIKKDGFDSWIRSFTISVSSIKSTSFKNADLTDAKFSQAELKSTNFRNATLTRVRWFKAKNIEWTDSNNQYLRNTQVRQWLIGEGKDKNFDEQKLQGISLEDADLSGASFINTNLSDANLKNTILPKANFDFANLSNTNLEDADLSEASFIDANLSYANLKSRNSSSTDFTKANLSYANLQKSNLSKAKLVQTQLDNTDLTGAILTGACIEDWGITTHTKLDGVECKYVFMRSPTEDDENRRRKPDNWEENFEGNDFTDFIKPFFDTLDLYHNQRVDPRAIAISWKQLAENNPDANLRFASMEVKGEDNLLLRLKTAPNADLSKLNAEYFETYNQLKALAAEEFKKLLTEKDERIQALETMVNTALKRPSFYAENYNHQGDNDMSGDRNIEVKKGNYNESIQGDYYEQSGNLGIGHMSGGEIKDNVKVAGVVNEAEKQNLAEAAAEIQTLLEQLSETYPTTTSREKNLVVGEAADRIENNPTLKTKVINALKAGGTEAFKEAVNHPLVNIFVATIEGWLDAE